MSRDPPNQGVKGGAQQQQANAAAPATFIQLPSAAGKSESGPCPETHQSKYDCNTVSAIANVRQADAAEWFNHLAYAEIGIGVITAVVATLAARWAKKAADAGAKSYTAFVAAEDANLVVEFPNGGIRKIAENGVEREEYVLYIRITNIGRSTARIHSCFLNREPFPAGNYTLKRDDVWDLRSAARIRSMGEFGFAVRYASPMRPNSQLTVTATVYKSALNPHACGGMIIKSELSELTPGTTENWIA